RNQAPVNYAAASRPHRSDHLLCMRSWRRLQATAPGHNGGDASRTGVVVKRGNKQVLAALAWLAKRIERMRDQPPDPLVMEIAPGVYRAVIHPWRADGIVSQHRASRGGGGHRARCHVLLRGRGCGHEYPGGRGRENAAVRYLCCRSYVLRC